MLEPDVRAVIAAQRLCFAATVTPDGRPNLSPKGTIRVLDDSRLFYCDIDSPGTRYNLERNPWIEINVVDQLSRRGYRLLGRAEIVKSGPVFDRAVEQIRLEDGVVYPVAAVVVIEVDRVLPITSPGYAHVHSEREMRELWRSRRAQLDLEFEQHLDRRGWLIEDTNAAS